MGERPSLEQWIRVGYAMRGLLFVALGALAWQSGRGQSALDTVGRLRGMPGGPLILIALGLGLIGLAMFRLAEAWLDLDGRGQDAGGRLTRAGRAIGGLAYGAVGLAALAVALAGRGAADVDAAQAQAAHGPGLLLILAGAGLIVAAGAQAGTALTGRFMRELEPGTGRAMRWLGAAGYGARAMVFFLLGWVTIEAGVGGARLRDSGEALDLLRQHPALFAAVTWGLMLFGLFSLAESRCRRIPGGDSLGRRASAAIARP